jgi:hypothetical protein
MIRLTFSTLLAANVLIFAALLIPGWLNPRELPDAFAPYDPLAPGQPTSVLNDYACNSIYAYDYWASGQSYCQITVTDALIRSVTVIYRDNVINTVWIHPREMRMADVVYRWGRPDDLFVSKLFYIARWESGVYATATTPGRFTLKSPVSFISVTGVPRLAIAESGDAPFS